jgi:hypothetical protein
MAEVKQYVAGEAWFCTFCSRYETDEWNAYRGYGYDVSKLRKAIVTPWKLDEARIEIEHHRVCGRTMPAHQLFQASQATLYQCTKCQELWYKFFEARDCCPKEET